VPKPAKTQYTCQDCGSVQLKWAGQCPDCGAWNSLVESVAKADSLGAGKKRFAGYADAADSLVRSLDEIPAENIKKQSTQIGELDRVLGGGLVSGSVTLIGGDPGIGKSTLLLQATCLLAQKNKVLYVTRLCFWWGM
jgi:DNA repair protein RadA/Sms